MTTYRPAPSVKTIAEPLIEDHPDLDDIDIRYVFRDTAAKSKGKVLLGKARKVSGLNAFLAAGYSPDEIPADDADHDFFVIEIAEDEWVTLTEAQRVALVDHELSHCAIEVDDDGNQTLVVRGHDLEEFCSVVARHGLWKPDVRVFAETAVKQLTLDIPRRAAS